MNSIIILSNVLARQRPGMHNNSVSCGFRKSHYTPCKVTFLEKGSVLSMTPLCVHTYSVPESTDFKGHWLATVIA